MAASSQGLGANPGGFELRAWAMLARAERCDGEKWFVWGWGIRSQGRWKMKGKQRDCYSSLPSRCLLILLLWCIPALTQHLCTLINGVGAAWGAGRGLVVGFVFSAMANWFFFYNCLKYSHVEVRKRDKVANWEPLAIRPEMGKLWSRGHTQLL